MPRQPIWRDIYAALKSDIAGGAYRTGDRLPTEKELSARFDVNRHTVRRALAELTTEGAITVRRGSGAYVAEGMIEYRLGARVKFSQNIRELGRAPAHRILGAETVAAEEQVTRHLNLRTGAPVTRIRIVSEADGLPILYSEHFFPAERFEGIGEACRETGSITLALARYGVTDYRRVWTRITARPPSRQVAAMLSQADAHPVLRAEGLNADMAGQPVEYAVGWWAGGRTQFVVDGG
jgi:GntR family phosphonate transport system transcriptional regulator